MAFTGSATIVQVSDGLCRITGLSLAGGAAGTIGLHGKTVAPDVRLPAGFKPEAYSTPEGAVALQDNVSCDVIKAAADTHGVSFTVAKTGTTDADFAITVTNDDGVNASPALEMYVRFK